VDHHRPGSGPAPIIKRGFGGSLLSDSEHFADRIIIPYKPKRVFVYAGDNDLAAEARSRGGGEIVL
jgi:hypothetical protein